MLYSGLVNIMYYCVLFNIVDIVSLEDLDSQIQNVANMGIQSQKNAIRSHTDRS